MPLQNMSNTGLAQILRKQLKAFAHDTAVKEGPDTITFGELHARASAVLLNIRKYGAYHEEPIAIVTSSRIDHIVSQVAVVYAGATCVPLEIDLPDEYIVGLLHHLNCSLVLTDGPNDHRLSSLRHILVDDDLPEITGDSNGHGARSTNSAMVCTHIFHTSGSTGKPKAVRVLERGLLNLIFNKFSPVARGRRVGQACNIGFDVSLWEIWSALLHGACLVVFSRKEILDAPVFRRKVHAEKIDVLWQTTSLLATIAHICPDAYSTVDTLLTGGEAINVQTVKTIFDNSPPRRVFNVYGPTELSVFAAYHQVSWTDLKAGVIPIGKPLSGYEAYVLDEELQSVPEGTVGELVVGGVGVAGGYFDDPEKTARVFVNVPHLSSANIGQPGQLYRTGDLVRRNRSGLLEYLGRRDNEVKILGQRVDLGSVERCLLETKLVTTAVALKVTEASPGGSSLLVAYVVPASPGLEAKLIQQAYVSRKRHLMTPRLKVVETIALTRSGKVDRAQLAREYHGDVEKATSGHGSLQTGSTSVEDQLRTLWAEILGLPPVSLSQQDDFFALGGTSLHAVRLVFKINQVIGVVVEVAAIFESPTLEGMSQQVRKVGNGVLTEEASTDTPQWIHDMALGRDLKVSSIAVPDWHSESEGRVFLTGSTGFVGAFLFMELIARTYIKNVACLVRAEDANRALMRIREALKPFGLSLQPEHEAKIITIPGDLSEEHFGLGKHEYERWAEWSSVVFHVAAHVNFVQPYSSHRTVNVLGTLHMIRFSQAVRSKSLHYISSISAYGPTGLVTGAKRLLENEPPESHKIALSYDTGYAQSQFTAETVIWNALYNGLPIAIYRLGSVLGHSATGIMNSDDFIGRLVRTCIQNGTYPSLASHREDFVPIDFAVSSLLHISLRTTNLGRAYNIVHPNHPAPELSAVFELINEYSGKPLVREAAYTKWLDSISRDPDHLLSSLMPMLQELVWDGRSRWQMQQDVPEFATDNLRRALSDRPELLECPSPSALIKTYVPHWLKEAGLEV
ncbi:hypothetical protein BJX70DRAFT_400243 [Aspergillus crustosus]